MLNSNFAFYTKSFLSILSISFLISCSASEHAGKTFVKEPTFDNENEHSWFLFYQDQFDAFEGNVIAPSNDYPKVAKQAYQRASMEWNDKVSSASTGTSLIWIGAGILIPTIITLLAL